MEYMIEDLVSVAKRENNNKRPYLYVNPLQGKHIPTDPFDFKDLCKKLAKRIGERYPVDKIMVVGFAETATAIAMEIAMSLENAVFVECTTRENDEFSEFSYFTESHSHATEQKIDTKDYKYVLRKVNRVVFVEDEVTTGNTIMKLVNILKSNFADSSIKFTISSLLNSMSEEREKELSNCGVDCIYVEKIPYEYNIEKISSVTGCPDSLWNVERRQESNIFIKNIMINMNQRKLTNVEQYRIQVNYFAEQVFCELNNKLWGKVLVVGTEEFMHPAIQVAAKIAESKICDCVKTHSTTRSPIVPSLDDGYPLKNRYVFRSIYDYERTTYLYNLECYDVVVLVTDAVDGENYDDVLNVLTSAGNRLIYVYRWR